MRQSEFVFDRERVVEWEHSSSCPRRFGGPCTCGLAEFRKLINLPDAASDSGRFQLSASPLPQWAEVVDGTAGGWTCRAQRDHGICNVLNWGESCDACGAHKP